VISYDSGTCACMGPQNGEPLCPCKMKHVVIQAGRYVEIIDHGPALDAEQRIKTPFGFYSEVKPLSVTECLVQNTD